MTVQSIAIRIGLFYPLAMFVLGATLARASTGTNAQEKTIASTRAGDLVITLANESGKFTADANHFCVLFQSRGPSVATEVQEVSVDFILLVGRIQERPLTAHLSPDGAGRHCGDINLGRQFYRPSNYYALVHYVVETGKKKISRLFVAIK